MPDETKGSQPVFPPTEGAQTPSLPTGPAQPVAFTTSGTEAKQAEAKAPAAPVKPAAKPADAAKPAAPATAAVAEKPAAATAKPAAPAAAKPAAPAKPAGPVPEPWSSDLVAKLKKQYGSGIREASTYVGQRYLVVDDAIVYEILRRMRDEEQYDYCVDITAVHYPKRNKQFDIVYILYSFPLNDRIRIKTQVAEGDHVRSACDIWPTANWLEREVFDMFGLIFDGHPDLKRILLPDGWQGHPLRKDYDILLQDKEWVQVNLGIESGQ